MSRPLKRMLSELHFTFRSILAGSGGLLLLAFFILLGLWGWEANR